MKKRNSMNLRRSFLGMLLVMAFMIIGAQQAEAQYMHPSEALSKIDQEVTQLMDAPTVDQIGLNDGSTPEQFRLEYVTGVAITLKANDDVQTAIDANHDGFLEKYPNLTAVANQLKTEVTALLEE